MATNSDMSIGRRSFLAGVSGVAAMGIPASVSQVLARTTQTETEPEPPLEALLGAPALGELECSTFEDLVDDWFSLKLPDGNWADMILLEAVRTPERFVPDPRDFASSRHPFSIIFRAVGLPRLPQEIYMVHHPEIGELPLFLVPVGQPVGNSITDYQAVFG